MKRIDTGNRTHAIFLTIAAVLGLACLFYYSMVHNIMVMIQFIQLCLLLGTLATVKELFVLLVIKKMSVKDILKDLGWRLFVYLFGVLLLLAYFGFIFYMVRV